MFNKNKNSDNFDLPYMTDDVLSKVVFDLETIGKLQKNQVINTGSEFVNIDDISYSTSITRTLTGDSRDRSINRVDSCLKLAYEMGERILESRYLMIYLDVLKHGEITVQNYEEFSLRIEWLKKISSALSCAQIGLNNLKLTYEKDSDTVGKINSLLLFAERKCSYINNCIEHLMQTKDEFEFVKRGLCGGTKVDPSALSNAAIPKNTSHFSHFSGAKTGTNNFSQNTLQNNLHPTPHHFTQNTSEMPTNSKQCIDLLPPFDVPIFKRSIGVSPTEDMTEISEWLNSE